MASLDVAPDSCKRSLCRGVVKLNKGQLGEPVTALCSWIGNRVAPSSFSGGRTRCSIPEPMCANADAAAPRLGCPHRACHEFHSAPHRTRAYTRRVELYAAQEAQHVGAISRVGCPVDAKRAGGKLSIGLNQSPHRDALSRHHILRQPWVTRPPLICGTRKRIGGECYEKAIGEKSTPLLLLG